MTDNEKRAHDLAIAMTPSIIKLYVDGALKNGESKVTTDIYREYLKIYNGSLDAFNHDFPDGK